MEKQRQRPKGCGYKSAMARGHQKLDEARKDSPLVALSGLGSCQLLHSDLHHCTRINFCYFKPPSI